MGIFNILGKTQEEKNQTSQPVNNTGSQASASTGYQAPASTGSQQPSFGGTSSSGESKSIWSSYGEKLNSKKAGSLLSNIGNTAYQKNVDSQNASSQATQPQEVTTRSLLSTINGIKNTAQKQNAFTQFGQFMFDPSTPIYQPYLQATNPAIKQLADLGITLNTYDDVNQFISEYQWLKQYYKPTANTNSLSTTMTNKKASPYEKAAYCLYQIEKEQETTQQTLLEFSSLKEEIDWWVNKSGLNLSDEDVIKRLNIAENNNYTHLAKMDKTRQEGTPMELNSAIDYGGEEYLYGMIWAARNDGGTGNIWQDMINSYDGVGNVWQADDALAAKMDRNSKDYSPFSVRMTGLDEEGLYFGVPEFTDEWVEANKDLMDDEGTAGKMYRNVLNGYNNRKAAGEELDKLNEYIDNQLERGKTNPQKILDNIDWSDYPTLAKINKCIGDKDGSIGAPLIQMTSALDYRYTDLAARVTAGCEANANKKNGDDTLNSFNPTSTVTNDVEFAQGGNQNQLQTGATGTNGIAGGGLDAVTGADVALTPEAEKNINAVRTAADEIIAGIMWQGDENYTPEVTEEKEAARRDAYDSIYGKGAYDKAIAKASESGQESPEEQQEADDGTVPTSGFSIRDMNVVASDGPMPTPTPSAKDKQKKTNGQTAEAAPTPAPTPGPDDGKNGTQRNEAVQNEKVTYAADTLDPSMTLAEKNFFKNQPGVEYDRIRDGMIHGPLNPELWTDPDFAAHNFGRARQSAEDNYASTSLGHLDFQVDYEQKQEEKSQLQASLDMIDSTYGDMLYAGEDVMESVTLEDGLTLFYDDETDQFYPSVGYTAPMMEKYGAESEEQMQAIIDEMTANARGYNQRVLAAKKKYGDDIPEDMPTLSEYNDMQSRLGVLDGYLNSGAEKYRANQEEDDAAFARLERMTAVMTRNGITTKDTANVKAAVDAAKNYLKWSAPEVDTARALYEEGQVSREASMQKANDIIASTPEALADDQYMLDTFGDILPEACLAKIREHMEWTQEKRDQAEWYLFSLEDDFNEHVKNGATKAIENFGATGLLSIVTGDVSGIGSTFGDAAKGQISMENMDDYEEALYYALCDKYGAEVADRYYNSIPVLERAKENAAYRAEELAQSGAAGRLALAAGSIATAPLEVVLSGINLANTAMNGEGDEWLQLPGFYSKTAYGAVQEEVANVYKDNPAMRDIVSTAYEIAYNRGRSAAVAATFGGLFSPEASEVVQAMPMALTAMDDTVQKYLDAGVEPAKAWALGTVAFLSESVTEGIELGHIKEAFGVGENLTKSALANFFKDYIPNALPEIVGESINDIAEKCADFWIAGDRGDLQGLMQSYIDQGLARDKQEAYDLMMRDQIGDVMHTALVSLLSPIADLGAVAAGATQSYMAYRQEAHHQQLYGNNVTVRDLRNGDIAMAEAQQKAEQAAEDYELNRPLASFFSNETQIPRTNPIASEETQAAQVDEYDAKVVTLDSIRDSDKTTQSASLAAVLSTGVEDVHRAGAAAVQMLEKFGSDLIDNLQLLYIGGFDSGVDMNQLNLGIQYAALGDGKAANVMNSYSFQQQDPATQAKWLAEAAGQDAQDSRVQANVQSLVHDFRVASEEKKLMAEGLAKPAEDAQAKAKEASADLKAATDELESRQAEFEAKGENLQTATEELSNDPGNPAKADQVAHTVAEVQKTSEVVDEYQQSVDNKQEAAKQAEAEAKQLTDETMAMIRERAEANVSQAEESEAAMAEEARAKAAEEQRLMEEEAAQKQAEEDEKSRKALVDQARVIGEQRADERGLTGEARDTFVNRFVNRAEKVVANNANMSAPITLDANGNLSNAEGLLALRSFERNTGLSIQFDDLGDPTVVRGKYSNGVVTLNKRMVQSGSITTGQALVEAALHEFTHAFENLKSYSNYAKTVVGILFGDGATYENNDQLRAAVDAKRDSYEAAGIDLTQGGEITSEEGALKEIVADYARTSELSSKESIERFLDQGLGGTMRNILHNINQSFKNFRLKGEEKVQAENFRRAERAYQKALTELSKTAVHPEADQFSIAQVAQATGMRFDADTRTLYDKSGNVIDGVTNKITPDMITETPVGLLIRNGLSNVVPTDANGNQIVREDGTVRRDAQTEAMDMMAGLMNMVARYRDSDLVWEIGASTLSSTFSALKSNSDPQYKTTVDFGTVCAKTQAIIDVMSKVMLDKIDPQTGMIKEGMKPGLTRQEIMDVYNQTHAANLSVPCPVCYVFSRWMGVPSLLGQMSQYQHDFVVTDEKGKIDTQKTQEKVDSYIQNALDKYGNAKALNNAKARLQSKQSALEEQRKAATTKEEQEQILSEMVDLDKQIGEVSAYNWLTQALCKKYGDKFVVDPKFKLTPDEILFDLNRTGEFAGYEKNWKYRNTRGAGMGKAIMPYSGETIGDVLYGVKKSGRQNSTKNPWINMDDKAATRQLTQARNRAKKQNLVGGQRLQSTSDFRPEWGLDYIMSFLELQAAGSKVQMYTKVAEAVDFFASVGADVNMSIMGQGQGYHEATDEEIAKLPDWQKQTRVVELGDKKYIMDFSSITGMNYDNAIWLKNKYDNAQMILVGMNDTHIRLAMANDSIDFIIPWHSSGNSKETLSGLISSVGEKLDSSVDYTTTQTDMVKGTVKKYTDENGNKVEYTVPGKQTDEEKKLWDTRVKLLTQGGSKLTEEDRLRLMSNPYTKELYKRFTQKGVDNDCYGVKLSKEQATQIFPYEYWLTTEKDENGNDVPARKENADINGKRFVEYCEAMGIVPRFSQFKDDPGYWKLLIDRPMYNNDGTYHKQQVIDVTNARIGALNEEGKLTDSDLPTNAQAKYAPTDPRSEHYEEYKERERIAIENSEAAIEKRYNDGSNGQFSVYGNTDETTDADIDQMLAEASEDYRSAVDRGDMDAAAEDVESYAASKGYTLETFHGTGEYFNEFRRGYEGIHLGNREQAEQIAGLRYQNRSERTHYNWVDIRDSIGDMNNEQRESLVKDAYYEQDYFEDGNSVPEYDGDLSDTDAVRAYADSIYQRYADSTGENLEDVTVFMKTFDRQTGRNIMHLYAKINNPFVINGDIGQWDPASIAGVILRRDEGSDTITGHNYKEIDISGSDVSLNDEQRASLEKLNSMEIKDEDEKWDMLSDVLGQLGYDGIQYLNQYEGDKNSYSYIALKQSDVKSADTVTYDDQGNVIPLEERFNDQNNDIRYSYDGDLTDADIDMMLSEGNVFTPEELDAMNDSNQEYKPPEMKRSDYSRPLEGRSARYTQETIEGGANRKFGLGMSQGSELEGIVQNFISGHSGYQQDTNADQIRRAVNWIIHNKSSENSDGLYESVQKISGKGFDYRSADGQARMIATMALAVHKGDIPTQVALADAFNRQGTDLGRSLQARKIFRMMTPEGRISTLQKMLNNAQDEIKTKTGKEVELKFSDLIYMAAAAAEGDGEFAQVFSAAKQELAEQLPASWKEKLVGIRMFSMLSAPTTHIRNTTGNLLMMGEVGLKNKVGALGELFLQATGVIEKGQRTKTIGFANPEARRFAKNDLPNVRAELDGESKYQDSVTIQNKDKKLFGTGEGIISKTVGRVFQKAYNANSLALEFEDRVFLNRNYRNALAGYMTANRLKAADMTGKTLEDARAYAINEAIKATFHDASKLASFLNDRDAPESARFVIDALLPFKKTPINIAKRGIEYSPVGLLKGVTYDAARMVQWQNAKRKGIDPPAGAISPQQWIDRVASGLTGSALAALGYMAGMLGMANGGFDDDDPEDQLKKLKGEQEYSINPGKVINNLFGAKILGEDATYTLDWAAPAVLPFFTGVSIHDAIADFQKDDDGKLTSKVLGAMLGMTEPMFNMTMLESVNSALETSQYEDGNVITKIMEKMFTNYISSFVPSSVGKFAKVIDTTRRMTYTESGDDLSTVSRSIEQMENKLPFVSIGNMPALDAWGNEDTTSTLGAILQNFISPGYVSQLDTSEKMDEIQRVYESTKSKDVVPKSVPKYFQVSDDAGTVKETVRLNDKQYYQMKKTVGETQDKLLNELIDNELYQMADDGTRARMINKVYQYSLKTAEYEIDNRVNLSPSGDAWIGVAYSDGNVISRIVDDTIDENRKAYIKSRSISMAKSILIGDQETAESLKLAMEDRGISDSEMRSIVSDFFRPMYQERYADEDYAAMNSIEDMLTDLDIGYSEKNYFSKWRKSVDTKSEKYEEKDYDEIDEEYDSRNWLDQNNGNTSGSRVNPDMLFASTSGAPSGLSSRMTSDQYVEGPDGMLPVLGNIDLNHRQVYHHPDGSISTEYSTSFYDEDSGKEVLIPTVINGQIVSVDEAIDYYYETGEYLGMFDTPEEAEEYAQKLSKRQDWYYHR